MAIAVLVMVGFALKIAVGGGAFQDDAWRGLACVALFGFGLYRYFHLRPRPNALDRLILFTCAFIAPIMGLYYLAAVFVNNPS